MDRIEGYELTEKIYEGSRTLVYRGQRALDRQPVIIKLLKNEYPTPRELALFQGQYTLAKELNLPNVIYHYSLETYRNRLAIVMEDFGAVSLSEYVNYKPLEVGEFLTIAIQIAQALQALHQRRIIHRDIKPSNLLINPTTGQVKITDFSIASILPRETQILKSPERLGGTLAYMSPEQTGRMNRGIDYRTDFYSLGITFYQLLTQQMPFESNDAMELVHCHIARQPISPNELNPQIPLLLSEIVMTLMAKNAEDRYQSAVGLQHDLNECWQQWKLDGEIKRFPLQQQDSSDRLQIPEKLYGREKEVEALLAAFERVAGIEHSKCRRELMLVAGYSGIGKSALVQEVYKPITQRRGYFIGGKFDQFQRNIPYSALVSAFESLMQQLLTESETKLQQWREKLVSALGSNVQVIVDVIPKVEAIVGTQTPVKFLAPIEAQNRFNLVFQNFIRVFCQPEHPLVLFLDDLQWADAATLQLLKLILTDEQTHHLFVIGAYRDNEVNATHPLMLLLEEVRENASDGTVNIAINQITLFPLTLEQTTNLITDSLHLHKTNVVELAELVIQKTQGNPFFIGEFLKTLNCENFLRFDLSQRCWQWEITEIERLNITDNVVDLMVSKLQKMSDPTQEILQLAACIGNSFNLKTLAIIAGKTIQIVEQHLSPAVQEGMVLPTLEPEIAGKMTNFTFISFNYKFLHDRVQQAAYSLIPEAQKKATHWQIGMLLLQNTPVNKQEEKIFEIVNQLNLGMDLIKLQIEKYEVIKLNQFASRKAKSATAYEVTAEYLNLALNLLADDSWQIQYELTISIYLDAIEAAYLNTNFELAEQLTKVALESARQDLDKVKLLEKKLLIFIAKNQLSEVLLVARTALAILGVDLPEEPSNSSFLMKKLEESMNRRGVYQIEELYCLDLMTEPYKIEAMRILMILFAPVLIGYPDLMPLLSFKMVDLCVNYGNSPLATFAYVFYGWLLCGVLGDIEAGYKFGQLGINLLNNFEVSEINCKTEEVFYGFVKHWKHHLVTTLEPLLKSLQDGIDIGDLEYAGYSATIYCHNLFFVGKTLDYVIQEQEKYIDMMQRNKQIFLIRHTSIICQLARQLIEGSESKYQLIGKSFDETNELPKLIKTKTVMSIFSVYFCKSILCYLLEDYHQALENARLADKYVVSVGGMNVFAEYYFYYSLTLLAVASTLVTNDASEESLCQYTEYLTQVNANQQKFKIWANHAPMNFLHKFYLVEAERYKILNQYIEAINTYDKAIKGAKENNYLHEEALANELAAKFYLGWGKETIAQVYITNAYLCYKRWGSRTKIESLEKRYSQILAPKLHQQTINLIEEDEIVPITSRTITDTSLDTLSNLDLTTVVKASQAIISEIELDKLLQKLIEIVIENAGSQLGILILNRKGELLIEAVGTIEPKQILVRQSISLDSNNLIPLSIIRYVVKAQENVVLIEANSQGNFTDDPYIIAHQTKSILCIPILGQGKLIGVLYLENNLISGAFTQQRSQLLKLLCSQAAIALENAQLYEEQKEYTKILECKVQERTWELQQKIDDRKRAEEALKQLNEELEQRTNQLQQEIEERRHIQEALQESELKYRNLVETSQDIIFSCNARGVFTFINQAIQQIHGYKPEEIIGRPFTDLIPPEQLVKEQEVFQRILKGESFFQYETVHFAKDGRLINLLFNAVVLRDSEGNVLGTTGTVSDITDRKRAEVALQKAKEAADTASRAKGEFLSKMSHELRTPLNAILGFSQLLNYDLSLTSQQQEYLGIINRAGEHLLALINDILEMSKIEAGRIELHENSFDLYRLLDCLEEMFKLKAESKGLQLIFNRILPLPQLIKTDENKLRQVLINLLGNAIKFTEKGSVVLRLRGGENLKINSVNSITFEEQILHFEVEDTGPGIAPEELTTLFNPFVQTKTGKKSQTGTGLGLPISRQFVQLMGGDITVNSTLNQGSVFQFNVRFSLPEAIDIPMLTATATRKVIALEPNQPIYRLLVVEDRFESRLLLVNLLSQVGFEVREAANGQEAITLVESWQPHLIWMDMQMPVMDGYEATQNIKAFTHKLTPIIIALTANAFVEDKSKVLSVGCDDFVSKPFREEVIFDKIAHYLGVRYIYEQIDLPSSTKTKAEATSVIFTLESLPGISPEYKAQIYQAAIALDDESIEQLCEQISDIYPQLVKILLAFTKNLRFDKIIELLDRLPNDERSLS